MELTLEAAVSSDAVWGHAAYFVLICSMLMRTLDWLRVLVIVSALLSIVYAVVILHDPVSIFWELTLILVNTVQLIRTHWRSWRARFTDDEARFVSLYLLGLSRGEAREVLDFGTWRTVPRGTVLTQVGKPVDHLTYVAHGTALVSVAGRDFATCREGDFIGEMTALIGSGATADAVTEDSAVIWQVDAARLRKIVGRHDRIARALDAAFAQNYRQKLLAMGSQAVQPAGPS